MGGENADLVVGVFAVPGDVRYVMSEDLQRPAMGGVNAASEVGVFAGCPAVWRVVWEPREGGGGRCRGGKRYRWWGGG